MGKEEAINILRKVHDNALFSVRTALETLVPELRDSEDERIRKAIILFFETQDENTTYSFVRRNDIIAWLEKHKYTEEDLDKAYKCADEVQYRRGYEDAKKEIEKQGEKLPVGFYYVNSEGKKFYSDTFKYGDVILHVEKQGEQKPADEVEQEYHCTGVREPKEATGVLKQLLNKENYAWSEEDETIFDSIIEDVMPYGECPDCPSDKEREYFDEGNRKVEWLKTLKSKIKGE